MSVENCYIEVVTGELRQFPSEQEGCCKIALLTVLAVFVYS